MTPQERQMMAELFDRLASLENSPRDPDAEAMIREGFRRAPNAAYALVQTVLVQDEALKAANARIQEYEQQSGAPQQPQKQPRGFLDNMRDSIFGRDEPRGSVPRVPPGGAADGRAVAVGAGRAGAGLSARRLPARRLPAGRADAGASAAGGGGSFLGTAAAAAAGMIGGSLLMGGIRSAWAGTAARARPRARSTPHGRGGIARPGAAMPAAAISRATPASTTSAARSRRRCAAKAAAPACSTAPTTTARATRTRVEDDGDAGYDDGGDSERRESRYRIREIKKAAGCRRPFVIRDGRGRQITTTLVPTFTRP